MNGTGGNAKRTKKVNSRNSRAKTLLEPPTIINIDLNRGEVYTKGLNRQTAITR